MSCSALQEDPVLPGSAAPQPAFWEQPWLLEPWANGCSCQGASVGAWVSYSTAYTWYFRTEFQQSLLKTLSKVVFATLLLSLFCKAVCSPGRDSSQALKGLCCCQKRVRPGVEGDGGRGSWCAALVLCAPRCRVCKESVAGGWRMEKAERGARVCVYLTVHMDTLYLEVFQVFVHRSICTVTAILFPLISFILLFFPLILCLLIILITVFSFLTSFSRSQPPPLAGLSPVGCNPRGAPDTVNSPFTRAAELLQTFLLIFTGLKASPFSLIIP